MKHEINAIATIAYRDFTKLLRDRTRIVTTFIFPFIFIGVLGGSFQNAISGFDFLTFVFTGVLGQTLFQSTASGLISLIEDRENDFSQEIFISPISRYTIIIGKVVGETSVALVQTIGIVAFGLIIGVSFTIAQLITLLPFAIVAAMLGGAFGVLVMANLNGQRAANQIFPFIIFPQFFLAGVFNPIKDLPPILLVLSRIAPMTYAVDLLRGVFYAGSQDYDKVVILSPISNILIITAMFSVFIFIGTFLFVKNERNK